MYPTPWAGRDFIGKRITDALSIRRRKKGGRRGGRKETNWTWWGKGIGRGEEKKIIQNQRPNERRAWELERGNERECKAVDEESKRKERINRRRRMREEWHLKKRRTRRDRMEGRMTRRESVSRRRMRRNEDALEVIDWTAETGDSVFGDDPSTDHVTQGMPNRKRKHSTGWRQLHGRTNCVGYLFN